MASQKLKLLVKSLYSDPNTLSEQPEGALAVADNVVIDRPSIAESRRGFKQFNSTLTSPKKLFNFQNKIFVQDGTTLKKDNGSGGWTSISGTFDGPSPNRPQSIQALESFYATTSLGIQKLESLTAALEPAGAPAGLDLKLATATGSFLANNEDASYRIVWGKTDANGVLVLGAPSENVNIENTSGGGKAVSLDFTVPAGLTTDWFYQIYRSLNSAGTGIPGGDELQLAIQKQLTSGDISTGSITITDDTPEALLGAALYTNATQEGIAQANYRPPYAQDIAMFNNFPFYLSTKQPQRLDLTMISVPALNDTVTIAGLTYTAKNAENIANHEFIRGVSGVLATDLALTIHSLIRNINRDSRDALVYGYYVVDGDFYLERKDFGASFTVTASASPFRQPLTATSTNLAQVNRLYIAKEAQPGAAPLLQFEDIGRADKKGLKLKSTRDALFIIKEDGIWRLTGTSPDNFVIEQYDTTVKCVGSETTDAFENTVFSSTNKGTLSIGVSGSQIISLPIQNEILRIQALTNFSSLAWGAAYDSDRKYLLGVPNAETSLDVEFVYVFNAKTMGWTRWPLDWRHALVGEGDDKLYAIRISDGQVLQERKSLTLNDYADDEFSITINSNSGNQLTLASVANLVVGMTIQQGSQRGVVEAINGSVVTVDNSGPWSNAAATAFKPIDVKLRWSEEDAENPGVVKHWSEITFFFQQCRFKNMDFACSSNFEPGFQVTEIDSRAQAGWGAFPWGRLPWGSGRGGFQAIRTYFPREVAMSLWNNMELRLSQCFNSFALSGASVIYSFMSSRFK